LAATALASWQFEMVKPAIDAIYRRPPAVGLGFFLTIAGLAVLASVGISLVVWAIRGERKLWRSD
jgi:hypothetical protein